MKRTNQAPRRKLVLRHEVVTVLATGRLAEVVGGGVSRYDTCRHPCVTGTIDEERLEA